MFRADYRAVDADFLRFRLPAPDHSHFYGSSGSALQESVGLSDGHIARRESANRFQNFAAAQGDLASRAIRNDRDNHDVAVLLRYGHARFAVHGILGSVAIV